MRTVMYVEGMESLSSVSAAALLLVAAATGADAEAAKRVVRTRHGAVRGTAKQSYQGRHFLAFYNIPFAKPPVGPLRFRFVSTEWTNCACKLSCAGIFPDANCSPSFAVLFHRDISQSGVSTAPWAVPEPGALDKARKVAAMVGCPTEPNDALVDCLRTVDDYTLTATEMSFLEWFICPLIPFRAAIEGEGEDSFLPKHPGDMEPHTAVPWITGVTIEEGYFHSAPIIANKTMLSELKENSKRLLPISVPYHLLPQADLINEKIHDFYFSRGFSNDKITEFFSDSVLIWPAVDAVGRYKDRAPVYFYLFSYKGKYSFTDLAGSEEISGVAHGDDLLYFFSNNSYYTIPGERPAKDMEVVKAMTKLWTNFGKTGNPTPNDKLIHWPRVTSDTEPEYLEIGEKLEAKKGLLEEIASTQ
ncbi:esterase E4-like [Schistocerca serialis cubense]|uniref:esterase E4-like n=1 Tax=Schistocerca serialis cubense TaxID=2023355 RepID=UPI00214E9340|nr:esterase E4-like [Schistocerca serialis cubense]